MTFTVFGADGRVCMYITGDKHTAEHNARKGRKVVIGEFSSDSYYFDTASNEIKERPVMTLDVSSEELAVSELLRIGNIPACTTVTHPEGEIVVNDGFIEWSSVAAGSYFFRFECFPYKEVEFNAIVR